MGIFIYARWLADGENVAQENAGYTPDLFLFVAFWFIPRSSRHFCTQLHVTDLVPS